MNKVCRECGKELQPLCGVDVCFECAERNAQKIFQEHPDIKILVKETINKMTEELE